MPTVIQLVKSKSSFIKGLAVLKFEAGSFFRVSHPEDKAAHGSIVIRTIFDSHPFVDLSTGSLWSGAIENYTFELVPVKQLLIEI